MEEKTEWQAYVLGNKWQTCNWEGKLFKSITSCTILLRMSCLRSRVQKLPAISESKEAVIEDVSQVEDSKPPMPN